MATDESDVTNHSVEIWDMETRQPIQRISLTGGSFGKVLRYQHVCLSPDGRCVLAAVNQDVWLYRARDGMLLHHFPPERTPDGSQAWLVTAAAFSPKGDMLLLWEIGTLGIYEAIDCQKEPAWELSRVETVTERIEKESRFDQLLRLADEALGQKDIPAALAALREADGVPGMEGNGALLDLWRRAGKYCRIGGVRRVGRPFSPTDCRADAIRFQRDGSLAVCANAAIECWALSTRSLISTYSNRQGWETGAFEHGLDDCSQPLHPAGVRAAFRFKTHGEAWITLLEVFDAKTGARICVYDQPYYSAEGSAVALSPAGSTRTG